MTYLKPTSPQLTQAATLAIAAYVVPQFQMPFRAQLLHKDINPDDLNKHWLQYLTGERKAMRHVAEALVHRMELDATSVPPGLAAYFDIMKTLLNVEDADQRRRLLSDSLMMHFTMLAAQRSLFEHTIKDCVQLVCGSKAIVPGSVMRQVEDIIFATAMTEYMKGATEEAAEAKGEDTKEEETSNA
jgi:hypothetical protein